MEKQLKKLSVWKIGLSFTTLLILAVLISCNKDEDSNFCPEEDLGEFHLVDSSRSSIPYAADMNLIFMDSLGNHAVFEFRINSKGYQPILNRSKEMQCKVDNSKRQIYTASYDQFDYTLMEVNNTLGIFLKLRLFVDFYVDANVMPLDMLYVFMGYTDPNVASGNAESLGFVVNPRNTTEEYLSYYPDPIAEVTLLDKTYYNVYTNPWSKFYYNNEIGIIAFRDKANKLWVYHASVILL